MPRKAIPFDILQRRGTAKSHHGTEADQVPVEAKTPEPEPGILGEAGQKEWDRIVGLLSKTKVLAEVDRTVLMQYCTLVETYFDDPKQFNAAQHTQLRLCAVELGLTPSARVKLRDRG